ncbi:MFS transporter [Ferrimicrobium sp.]|uniref:MFS transporter n=1 Tax=Ferrimicrobium sp. TaxID=2926050 RepID=UPI00262626F7|nr:MFS transporter [Ferrimicrobium sp.]
MLENTDGSPKDLDIDRGASIVARLNRIPVWSLSWLFVGVIGVGFLFTFFDIFDINVSFIQTCTEIVKSCTPATASGIDYLGLAVTLNLVGYVIGTLLLSPLADRFGRRDMLLVTMLVTGIGSVATGLTGNLVAFDAARLITGLGIGADLAIVNTYINEVAPPHHRARYTSIIFIMSALGAFFGIWLGLWLTTPATKFPLGLPFAIAGPTFTDGWRVMYFIGAGLALVGLSLRMQLPESPRWLVGRGRLNDAEQVVASMETRASQRAKLRDPNAEDLAIAKASLVSTDSAHSFTSYRAIFSSQVYKRRMVFLLVVWLLAYVTVYAIASGLTSFLVTLKFAPPEAGMIAAIGTFGFIACAIFASIFGDRLERKLWMPISAVITLVGALLIAIAGSDIGLSFLGSAILFFGFNLWVPMAYTWTTENFPTRARTTGFAMVDGIGHLGGGLGILIIAPILPHVSKVEAVLLISGFLIVAAIIAQFGARTKGMTLEETAP